MSNKERIIQLLDNVPEYKMGYVLAYLQGITADDYINDPDPEKDKSYTLEECKKEWGLC